MLATARQQMVERFELAQKSKWLLLEIPFLFRKALGIIIVGFYGIVLVHHTKTVH